MSIEYAKDRILENYKEIKRKERKKRGKKINFEPIAG